MQRLRLFPTCVAWARGCASPAFPRDAREKLTKCFAAVKEETRGQALDLTDMSDASRKVMRSVQDALKAFPEVEQDAKFKGKLQTLTASLKAYNSRLSTLQNEARSMQADVDGLLKHMWGAEQPSVAPSPGGQRIATQSGDFGVDAPSSGESDESSPKSNTVETVEGEIVRDAAAPKTATESEAEIEIETVEIEPPAASSASASSSSPSGSSAASSSPASGFSKQVENKSVTEITRELHEKGVNFSDCMDAKTLRQRYQDYLDGKIATAKATPPPPPPQQAARRPANNTYYEQQQQQQRTPNTTETGLASDPYPNAERKMIDPMKYVWQVKQEYCAEKGVDPQTFDLWSGKVRLDDSKRLIDFPTIQNFPLEMRQKGNPPAGAYN
jgi:hypothetical protein